MMYCVQKCWWESGLEWYATWLMGWGKALLFLGYLLRTLAFVATMGVVCRQWRRIRFPQALFALLNLCTCLEWCSQMRSPEACCNLVTSITPYWTNIFFTDLLFGHVFTLVHSVKRHSAQLMVKRLSVKLLGHSDSVTVPLANKSITICL